MTEAKDNPLNGLQRLVGGRWYYNAPEDAPLSYHSYESKMGGKFIVSKSYAVGDEGETLISQSMWYWNPTEGKIKAVTVAQGMGIDVFEYTGVKVQGDIMTCDLIAHSDQGSSEYVETWEFPDDDHYDWALLAKSPEGLQKVMDSSFERKG